MTHSIPTHVRILGTERIVRFTSRPSRTSPLDGFIRVNGVTVSGFFGVPLGVGQPVFTPRGIHRYTALGTRYGR